MVARKGFRRYNKHMNYQTPAWQYMLQFKVVQFQGKDWLVENWDSVWLDNPAIGPKHCIELTVA